MPNAAPKLLTIGALATAAGVPTSTVRFYERRGLLRPDARSPANYRGYTAYALDRLRFIRSAQASGFALDDVAEMLALTGDDGSPCADVAALIERRVADVRRRIRALRRVERTLATSLASLCKEGPDWCAAIERLKRPPAMKTNARLAARA